MVQWLGRTLAIATLAIFGAACMATPADLASRDDESAGDDGEDAVAEAASALDVPPGCYADLTGCPAGAKTCSAWGAWGSCSEATCASFSSCGSGDFGNVCGRTACNSTAGTGDPQNRSRNCTMHATGAACVQYDYRIMLTHCGC